MSSHLQSKYKNLGTGNFKIITEQERGIMIDSCIWTLSQVVQVKKVRKKSFPRFLVVPVPSELL